MSDLHVPDDWLDAIAERAAAIAVEQLRAEVTRPNGWLTTRQAAEYASCSTGLLHKEMAAGRIRYEQDGPGCKAFFKAEWLDSWRQGEDPH